MPTEVKEPNIIKEADKEIDKKNKEFSEIKKLGEKLDEKAGERSDEKLKTKQNIEKVDNFFKNYPNYKEFLDKTIADNLDEIQKKRTTDKTPYNTALNEYTTETNKLKTKEKDKDELKKLGDDIDKKRDELETQTKMIGKTSKQILDIIEDKDTQDQINKAQIKAAKSKVALSETELTAEELKKFKTETLDVINELYPKVYNNLPIQAKKDEFERNIVELRDQIDAATKPEEVISAVEAKLNQADEDTKKAGREAKALFGENIETIKKDVTQGIVNFEKVKGKYLSVQQIAYPDMINKLATREYFEEPQYKDAFKDMFNKAKGEKDNDSKSKEVINFENYIKRYSKITNGTIDYEANDNITQTYKDGTEIIKVTQADDINEVVYIIFGSKEQEHENKAEKAKTLEITNFETDGKLDLTKFDYRGYESFKVYLSKKYEGKPEDFKKDMPTILNEIKKYSLTNLYVTERKAMDTKEGLRNGFFTKLIEEVTSKDEPTVQAYIKLINPEANKRELENLGDNREERIKNLNLIKTYAQGKGRENGTEAQKLERGKILIIESKLNPEDKEKQVGMLQSVINILNGDYENTNPLMKKLFFMIAEFFGGKERLNKNFPKLKDKIDDFYAKEFKLNSEKKSAISNIYTDYESIDNKGFDNKNYDEFEKNFTDKDNVLFDAKSLETSIKNRITVKNDDNNPDEIFKNMDPQVIQYIVDTHDIQGAEDLIKTNKDNKPEIDPSKITIEVRATIVEEAMNDEKIRKEVKKSYLKGDDKGFDHFKPTKDSDGNIIEVTNEQKISNGNDVAIAFTTYLMSGSKEHFYNVLTENNLDKNNSTKQEIKSETERTRQEAIEQAEVDKILESYTNTETAYSKLDSDLKTTEEQKAEWENDEKITEILPTLKKVLSEEEVDNYIKFSYANKHLDNTKTDVPEFKKSFENLEKLIKEKIKKDKEREQNGPTPVVSNTVPTTPVVNLNSAPTQTNNIDIDANDNLSQESNTDLTTNSTEVEQKEIEKQKVELSDIDREKGTKEELKYKIYTAKQTKDPGSSIRLWSYENDQLIFDKMTDPYRTILSKTPLNLTGNYLYAKDNTEEERELLEVNFITKNTKKENVTITGYIPRSRLLDTEGKDVAKIKENPVPEPTIETVESESKLPVVEEVNTAPNHDEAQINGSSTVEEVNTDENESQPTVELETDNTTTEEIVEKQEVIDNKNIKEITIDKETQNETTPEVNI